MYCETCGTENSETAKFCKSCGASIEQTRNKKTKSPPLPNRDISIGFGDRNTSEDIVLHCSLCNG